MADFTIYQGQNRPLVITFEESIADCLDLHVGLYTIDGAELKHWYKEDITISDTKAICPLTQESTMNLDAGTAKLEIKYVNADGCVIHVKKKTGKIIQWDDKHTMDGVTDQTDGIEVTVEDVVVNVSIADLYSDMTNLKDSYFHTLEQSEDGTTVKFYADDEKTILLGTLTIPSGSGASADEIATAVAAYMTAHPVTDTNTTYTLSLTGTTLTLTDSAGKKQTVTLPTSGSGGTDTNTTYELSISDHTITLAGSDGSKDSVIVPDNNTTYDLSGYLKSTDVESTYQKKLTDADKQAIADLHKDPDLSVYAKTSDIPTVTQVQTSGTEIAKIGNVSIYAPTGSGEGGTVDATIDEDELATAIEEVLG